MVPVGFYLSRLAVCVLAAQMCRACGFAFMHASLCALILECAGIKGKRPGSALERASEGAGHAASRRRPTSAAARFCRYVRFLSWRGFCLSARAPRQCGAPATRVELCVFAHGRWCAPALVRTNANARAQAQGPGKQDASRRAKLAQGADGPARANPGAPLAPASSGLGATGDCLSCRQMPARMRACVRACCNMCMAKR